MNPKLHSQLEFLLQLSFTSKQDVKLLDVITFVNIHLLVDLDLHGDMYPVSFKTYPFGLTKLP